MIISCLHGYFMVTEQRLGEVARFNSLYGQDLKYREDGGYYTFSLLADAPDYSIALKPYLNLPAVATYAGTIPEVFEKNGFIYDFGIRVLMPIASITTRIKPVRLMDGYYTKGLIMPGAVTPEWQKISGYHCHFDVKKGRFEYSEVYYA